MRHRQASGSASMELRRQPPRPPPAGLLPLAPEGPKVRCLLLLGSAMRPRLGLGEGGRPWGLEAGGEGLLAPPDGLLLVEAR